LLGRVGLAAACVIGCSVLGPTAAQAATIAVDIEVDTVAADGHCSLREAITSANTDTPPFAGAGECAAGVGLDVVTLPAGHFTLSRSGAQDDTNVNGDLDVLGAGLTVRGQGAAGTTVDANRIDRVFDVPTGRTTTIESLTITGGQAPMGANGADDTTAPPETEAQAGPGDPGGAGGGVRNAGTLTITDATIADNRAGTGGIGGIAHGGDGNFGGTGTNGAFGAGGGGGVGGAGGGIFTSGSLTLTRVIVTGNKAGAGGLGGTGTGGQGGAGTSGNGGNGGNGAGGHGGEGGNGGGVAAAPGATLTIDQSAISGNTAGDGGHDGLGQGGAGGVTSGNGSTGGSGGSGDGGFFASGRGGWGGGIYSADPITVTRSLVTGNVAGAGGVGGNGTGGLGGHAINTGSNSATGGHGGAGLGSDGGDGGGGGGIYAKGQFINVTVTANRAGNGADAGTAKGGNGGVSVGGPTGATGGSAWAGDGGDGGFGGAVYTEDATFRHATVTANDVGTHGTAGVTMPGSGGSPGGSTGGVVGGQNGFGGFIGGLGGFGSTKVANTVIAGNALSNCPFSGGGIVDGGHNFAFPKDDCPATGADPLLGPLADNGGPTMTQALLTGSPAIDAVPADAGCDATDQRTVARPQGPACDSGAFEVGLPVPPTSPPTESGPGPTSEVPPDTSPPTFVSASLKPARFAVNRRGARETPVSAKARKGTTFRFRLSEDARVLFVIERPTPGRRVKGRCVKPTRSNRRKPKCTRYAVAGRFAMAAKGGDNTKRFSGLIGRRALKPARYRATLIAKDAAGNASKPKRLNFRVVRR
jgi:CSLREA domain-containing protein